MNSSTQNAFWVEDLELRNIAGVTPATAFSLNALSPQINIIYGPNGCGKSTTATALQSLLWPRKLDSFRETHAAISVADVKWDLRLRGKEVEAFKEGEAHALPAWAAPETRSRYHWSLQNLLKDQDRDLANQVAKEMAGGIDFQDLSQALNWTRKPSAPQKLHQKYQAAEKRLRSAKEAQQALLRESKKMGELRRRLQQEEKSVGRSAILTMAREFAEKKQALATVLEELDASPPGMSELRGDDARSLEEMLTYVKERRERQSILQEQRASLGVGETSWATFGEEDFQEARKEISHLLAQWSDFQRELKETSLTLSQMEAKEQALRIEMGLQPQTVLTLEKGFSFPQIREWIRIVFKSIDLQAQQNSLRTDLPENPPSQPVESLEALRDARRDLESWLKAQTPTPVKNHVAFILSMLMFSVVLIYLCSHFGLSWGLLLALLPPPALHFLLHRLNNKAWLESLQSQFPENLSKPESWTAESVRERLTQIDQAIQVAYDQQSIDRDLRRLASVETTLSSVSLEMETLSSSLQEKGVHLKSDPEWMAHFLETVQDWRRLRNECAGAEAAKDQLECEQSDVADGLRNQLRKWAQPEKEASLQTACQQLLDRMDSELERRRKLNLHEIHLQQNAQQLNEKQEAIQRLCERVHLPEPDLPTLQSRVASLETWQALFRRSESLQVRISELRKEVGENLDLSDLSQEQLDQQLAACELSKHAANELRDQISKLEQRIQDQQKGRGVHEAEEALERCREELAAERDAHLEVRLGMEISAWLQDQCLNRDRSTVLKEANKNLRLFSNSTLQLQLSLEKSGGDFTASKPGHASLPLNRLSSGERTQVLMAVRLAFIHLNEQVPLPLLVDEALATSDDTRSEQIIHALIEVSKQGRQLFYFTAQEDEVEKWRQSIQAASIQASFIELASVRGQALQKKNPRIIKPEIQAVDARKRSDEDREAWAKRLGIPGWNPHQPVEDLSLWWILQDHEPLFTELFERGITLVGQWEMYAASGTFKNKPGVEDLQAKIRFIRKLQKVWRVGRPKPVPDQALLESGAVTDRFLPGVVALNQEVEGNATKLIGELKSKKVSGFQKQKITDLENYFYQQGYISDRPALEEHQAVAKVSEDMGEVPPATHRLAGLFF